MAILSGSNIRSATVTSLSEMELLILSKKNYEYLVEKHNKIAFKILKSITSNLCERIKRQSDQVVFLRLFG
jgi:CRP-like cAMP-binding protein